MKNINKLLTKVMEKYKKMKMLNNKDLKSSLKKIIKMVALDK